MNIAASPSTVNVNFRIDAIDFINNIPSDWRLTPVAGKAPFLAKWEQNGMSGSKLLATLSDPRVTGFGLIFGCASNGIIGIDHDGESVDEWIQNNVGDVAEALPRTVTVTSGRVGRYTKLYRVPEDKWDKIKTKKIDTGKKSQNGKAEQIEFRWERSQSVVFGRHPDTKEFYRFWDGCEQNTDIADCPEWVYRFIEVAPGTKDASRKNQEGCNSSLAKWCLDRIDPNKIPSFEEWRGIIFACHHEGIEYDDVLNWCEKYNDHDEDELINVWRHIKGRGNNPNTIGTLYHLGIRTESFTQIEFLAQANKGKKAKSKDRAIEKPSEGIILAHLEKVESEFHKFFFVCPTETEKTVMNFYDKKYKVWAVTQNLNFAVSNFVDHTIQSGLNTVAFECKDDAGKPVLNADGKAETATYDLTEMELATYYRLRMKDYLGLPSLRKNYTVEPDNTYVGFADCTFNVQTKERLEPSQDHRIFTRSDRNFEVVNPEVIEEYRSVLRGWHQSEVKGDAHLAFIKCAVLQLGDRIKNMLFLSGEKGSGKTSLCKLFSRMYDSFKDHTFFSIGGDVLGEQFQLEGFAEHTSVFAIEELTNLRDKKVDALLKQLLGSEKGTLRVEGKGIAVRRIKRRFAVIADCQDIPRETMGEISKGGRIVFLASPWADERTAEEKGRRGILPLDFYNEQFKPLIENDDKAWELFLAILQHCDQDEALANWASLSTHPEVTAEMEIIDRENDYMLEFAEKYLEVTMNPDDRVSVEMIRSRITFDRNRSFFDKQSNANLMKTLRKSMFRESPELKDLHTKCCPQYKVRCRITKKMMNGLIGVKLQELSTVSDF